MSVPRFGIFFGGKGCEPNFALMHRILVVSENAFLRHLVLLSLSDLDVELRAAEGVDAMQGLCRTVGFDLVILLTATPFLCGRDVVHTLRPAGLRRPLVYVLSWQQSEQVVLGLLECGVDQYMTFPVSLNRLRGKVVNELRRSV